MSKTPIPMIPSPDDISKLFSVESFHKQKNTEILRYQDKLFRKILNDYFAIPKDNIDKTLFKYGKTYVDGFIMMDLLPSFDTYLFYYPIRYVNTISVVNLLSEKYFSKTNLAKVFMGHIKSFKNGIDTNCFGCIFKLYNSGVKRGLFWILHNNNTYEDYILHIKHNKNSIFLTTVHKFFMEIGGTNYNCPK